MDLAESLQRIFEAASRQSGTCGLRKLILVQSSTYLNPETIFRVLPKHEFERILIGGLEHFDTLHEIVIPFHFITLELVLTLSRLENLRKLCVTTTAATTATTTQGTPAGPVIRGWMEEMMQVAFSRVQGAFPSLVELEVRLEA